MTTDAADQDVTELETILRKFLATRGPILDSAVEAVAASFRAGGKILVFGNGGSAAEALHFAAELVNGFLDRARPALPAVALSADPAALTAIGNDRGFDEVFSRQVEALGRPGDVAMGLSTSGRSPDVLRALRSARAGRLVTVGLTGAGAGDMPRWCDYLLDVPSCSTPRVQEAHLFILHRMAGRLESFKD